jgi:hypothetical protein
VLKIADPRQLSRGHSFRVEQEPTERTENGRSEQPVRLAVANPSLVNESEYPEIACALRHLCFLCCLLFNHSILAKIRRYQPKAGERMI